MSADSNPCVRAGSPTNRGSKMPDACAMERARGTAAGMRDLRGGLAAIRRSRGCRRTAEADCRWRLFVGCPAGPAGIREVLAEV